MSATSYYECHLTMVGDPAFIKPLVEAFGWKFSQIEGDIVLGDGIKCYATKHYNAKLPADKVRAIVDGAGDRMQRDKVQVIRRKVELVIYDDRSKDVRPEPCNGACIGCHLDDYEERDASKLKAAIVDDFVANFTPEDRAKVRKAVEEFTRQDPKDIPIEGAHL